MKFKTAKRLAVIALFTLGIFNFSGHVPDEGMFPLSDIHRAGLKKAGLKISEKDIYDPGNVSLVDALVRVGGCSGSFVSPEGLIITNHHCAFGAVQAASTSASNYLENGFVAESREQEIEAKGLTIRITDSYEDVSEEVLSETSNISDPTERIESIQKKREEIAQRAEAEDPTIKAEVSEMFIGKSYVLFKYKTIEDVRLVYIPRQDIGEFGGETDNWIWPRHTGDFSFLRAYVAPDGSSAKYAEENIPYTPKKHLKINPKGVEEDDFVFILGYPGRTFRHRPAEYIEYQEQYLLPYVSELNDFQNQQMYEASKKDKETALKLINRIKGNANVMKNYRGKINGLKNIDLVNQKKKEDAELEDYIQRNKDLKDKYSHLFADIRAHYAQVLDDAPKEMILNNLYRSSNVLRAARLLNSFREALAETDTKQKELFQVNIHRVKEQLEDIYNDYDKDVEISIWSHMYEQAQELNEKNKIQTLSQFPIHRENTKEEFSKALNTSSLRSKSTVQENVLKSAETLLAYEDELMEFEKEFNKEYTAFQNEQKRREGILNKLMADYVAVKEVFQGKDFVPDANSTLRLTFGNIKGYNPVDATYMDPISTLRGVIEKGRSEKPEYRYPATIYNAWEKKDFGPYKNKERGDVPVNILYNMDTTGGNSGSPIMNAHGELIGVNFDRAYEATINDFAWDESYSRSIGVDIRYVLWIADKIDNVQFILKEMGV